MLLFLKKINNDNLSALQIISHFVLAIIWTMINKEILTLPTSSAIGFLLLSLLLLLYSIYLFNIGIGAWLTAKRYNILGFILLKLLSGFYIFGAVLSTITMFFLLFILVPNKLFYFG